MRQREGERDRAAEAVADQHGIVIDLEFVEAVLDRRDIGIQKRQHGRRRTVEAGQIEQGHAVAGGKLRQHRVESMTVRQQRVQQHEIAPGRDRPARTAVRAPVPGDQLLGRHDVGHEFSL